MAHLEFTPNLAKLVDCPAGEHDGASVAEVFASAFVDRPRVRGYILDDRGALRKYIMVFVNESMIEDRASLSDPTGPTDRIFVMQALSGG